MGQHCYNPAKKVESQEAQMAAGIFDRFPKDPEKQHIAGQVQHIGMKKHGSDGGKLNGYKVVGQLGFVQKEDRSNRKPINNLSSFSRP